MDTAMSRTATEQNKSKANKALMYKPWHFVTTRFLYMYMGFVLGEEMGVRKLTLLVAILINLRLILVFIAEAKI